MVCLDFSKHGAVHDYLTSPNQSHHFKGHSARTFVVCSQANLYFSTILFLDNSFVFGHPSMKVITCMPFAINAPNEVAEIPTPGKFITFLDRRKNLERCIFVFGKM